MSIQTVVGEKQIKDFSFYNKMTFLPLCLACESHVIKFSVRTSQRRGNVLHFNEFMGYRAIFFLFGGINAKWSKSQGQSAFYYLKYNLFFLLKYMTLYLFYTYPIVI